METREQRAGSRRVDEDSLIDQVIDDRYRITQKIGAGGVGVVYRAEHVMLRRDVAVKVLQREYAARAPLRRRFEREARAMAALTHANIVKVTDFGLWQDLPYLVMELLEGRTLKERLAAGRLGAEELMVIARQLLRAAAHAHEQGLVHRDLKPGNIILGKQPGSGLRVSILDFGLAKFVTSDGEDPDGTPKLTVTGMAFGTPTYLAPEQAAGGKTDRRTDLYSIGVMLFEMITGSLPFKGETGELMRQHLFAPPPKLAEFFHAQPRPEQREVSPGLEAIFEKVLAKERSKRFQEALELLDALEEEADALRRLLGSSDVVDGTEATIFAGGDGITPPTIADDAQATAATAQDLPSVKPADGLEYATTAPDAGDGPRSLWPRPGLSMRTVVIGVVVIVLFSVGLGAVVAVWATADDAAGDGTEYSRVESGGAVGGERPSTSQPVSQGAHRSQGETPPATDGARTSVPAPPPAASKQGSTIWAAPMPPLIAEARARFDSGRQISDGTAHQLRAYAWRNKQDARPLLLLARYRLKRNNQTDAVDRYERAYAADTAASTDPQMLPDLIELSTSRSVGWRAARAVKEIYGAGAIAAVDRALADPSLDTAEARRLRQLRGELAQMSR